MTAVTPAVGVAGPARPGRVRWWPLVRAALRQRRGTLVACGALACLAAIGLAVTGGMLHAPGLDVYAAGRHSRYRLFEATFTTARLVLALLPVVAGLFLGAQLIARELETGSARFAWTQAAGRTRWLLASAAPVALLLAVAGLGLGLEFRWWASPLLFRGWPWRADLFGLSPLPYAGWMLLGFSLAVFLGAVIRRTVPAMAAALATYLPLMVLVAITRLQIYLPPLHRAMAGVTFSANGGFGYAVPFARGPAPDVLSIALGWPDGTRLTQGQLDHGAGWFRLHHITVWLTYQPGSRLGLFELIEFGWLTAVSVLLIGATVLLIRRRAA